MIDSAPYESGISDVMYLLERLEEVLSRGAGFPFTRKRLIDDEECLGIIEQIRLGLPHEIRQARRLNAEREALLDEAQARAAQIIRAAEADAEQRVQDHHVARRAETRGQEILTNADRRVQQMRREADEYAYSVLADLEQRLESLLSAVRGGLLDLEGRHETRFPEETEEEGEEGGA